MTRAASYAKPVTNARAPILTVCAILIFAFIYLPIVVLILYSFNRDGVGFTNFWVWAVYASIFFGVTAQRYQHVIRNAGAAEPVLREDHRSQLR